MDTRDPRPLDPQSKRIALIREILGPHEDSKIHVKNIPEKKERKVRKHVMPIEAQRDSIIAIVDLGILFTSGKNAIVLTDSHWYSHYEQEHEAFLLSDIESVKDASNLSVTLELTIEDRGTIKVPCGDHPKLLEELLKKFAAMNGGT